MGMDMTIMGSKVKPQKFKCGGWTDCEEDHDFYKPEDVLILTEAMEIEAFRDPMCEWSPEREAKAIAEQTLYVSPKAAIPTMLGMWREDCSVN